MKFYNLRKKQLKEFYRAFNELIEKEEERVNELFDIAKESYEGRLSESGEDDS